MRYFVLRKEAADHRATLVGGFPIWIETVALHTVTLKPVGPTLTVESRSAPRG